MTPDTRTAEIKRLEDSIESAKKEANSKYDQLFSIMKDQGQQWEHTANTHEAQIEGVKDLLHRLTQQLESVMQKFPPLPGESSQSRDKHAAYQNEPAFRPTYTTEGRPSNYKVHRPKHLFPVFEGEDVHRWLYKCNQYFDIEEIDELDKLKLASYYLDGIALYWHQNFMRNLNNHRVSWGEYVEALCNRFGGQRDPMEDLIDLKQVGTLETYIHDFDVLWNKAGIGEKQALVIFLGGLELEIKNTVKMFEPKDLRQAFNLARLQANTLLHRQHPGYIPKHLVTTASHSLPPKPIHQPNLATTPLSTASNIPAVRTPSWPNSSQNSFNRTPNKPTKSIKNQEFEERRLKGLCFWCDDKFVPGHRCKNKRLYSLSILEDEEETNGEEVQEEEVIPHISLNALEGTVGFHTMKVTGRTGKQTLHILVDSGSTHNFLNSSIASRLQSELTTIMLFKD